MYYPEELALIGFASGVAANNPDCALGPWYLYYHPSLFAKLDFATHWQTIVQSSAGQSGRDALPVVEQNLLELGQKVLTAIEQSQTFCVIGGDHSCAIGTWSAVAFSMRARGDIGLIWIDAHMDSHTPATSESQNIHGMPVAHLLGHGEPSLCQLFDAWPKLKPENICLVGIRSYQAGEAQLLERLGVKVFFMKEVQARGIDSVLREAQAYVSKNTCGFGISIDMDGIDPEDAPGVGCREPGGIEGKALVNALAQHVPKEALLALEISEYNPLRDHDAKSAQLLVELLGAVYTKP